MKNFTPPHLIVFVSIVGALFLSYKVGYWFGSREMAKNLAFVSLSVVEPALIISEIEQKTPGSFSKPLRLFSEEAILMVARFSIVFRPLIKDLSPEHQNNLCVIAKNRKNHMLFYSPSNRYDEILMSHLAQVHQALEARSTKSAPAEFKCAISPKRLVQK